MTAPHRRFAGAAGRLPEVIAPAAAILGAGAIVGSVVFVGWFRTGASIARGDIAVPVRDGLAAELGDQWTHLNTGAGGPTYELVRIPELASFRLAELLGGGEALGQRLLYTAEYAFAAAAVAALAYALARRWLPALVAAVVAFANPYVLNTVPNTLPMLAVGIVAATTAPFVLAARGDPGGRRRRWLVAAAVLGTLPASYLSVNPPLLALVAVAALAAPAVAGALTGTGVQGARRSLAMALRVAPWAIAVNLWWLVPMGFALTRAVDAGTVQAETDVATWSWTQRNNSVANVLTMVANWTWGDPVYHSREVVDAARSIQVGAWAFPAILGAAPLLARAHLRRAALWAALAVVVVVPLAKGLHPPFSEVNDWLFRHVPGAWLFREPMSKLGVVAVLACAVGAACLADAGGAWLARTSRERRPVVVAALGMALVVPASVCWPLWTGDWVPQPDGELPGAEVTLPDGWREVAAAVNGSTVAGKALVLPLGDFYQLPTTWGYYGIDNTARQLLTRPVIVRQPESYIGDPPAFDALVRGAEGALLGEDPAETTSLLRALGVSHVVLRHDLDRASAMRVPVLADDVALGRGLREVPGLVVVEDNEVATVWEVTGESWSTEPVQVLGGLLTADGVATEDLPALVSGTPGGLATATAGDPGALAVGAVWAGAVDDVDVDLPSGEFDVAVRSDGSVLASIEASGSAVALRDAVTTHVGETTLERRPEVRVEFEPPANGARLAGVEVDGVPIDLAAGPAIDAVPVSASIAPLWAVPGDRVGPWGEVADCNRHRDLDLDEVGIEAEATSGGVRLHADAHSACIAAPVAASPGDVLRVQVHARSVSGGPARACLWYSAARACAPLPTLAGEPGEWVQASSVVTVPAGSGEPVLHLYADAPHGIGATTTEFTDVRIGAVTRGPAAAYAFGAPRPTAVDLAGGEVPLRSTVAGDPLDLGPWGPVVDCHRRPGRTLAEAGIEGLVGSDAVSLRARAGVACTEAAIEGVAGGMVLEVGYRLGGEGGRTCLWQSARQRCAPVERRLDDGGVVAERVRLDPAPGAVRLFVYADAELAGAPVAVDLHDVEVRLVPLGQIRIQEEASAGPTPTIAWSQDGPTRYRVEVRGATSPYVLSLADTFSSDWRLAGLPAGSTQAHVELDGYRNGWVLDAPGDYEVVIEYVPARHGRTARAASAVALLAGGVALLRPRRRRA